MIKRIIFDLDNTLITWKEEYWNAVNRTFEKLDLQYTDEDIEKIKCAVDYYEDGRNDRYNKKIMKNTLEQFLEYELPENFIEIWLENLGECAPTTLDKEVIDTLEYLKQKYDLVVLTNWFRDSQADRLKTAGINKYFSNVYATEELKMKPDKEGFETAKGNLKNDECVVVGDSLKTDVQGAINADIDVIWLDNMNIVKSEKTMIDEKEITVIHKFSELKKYL